ncbi:hypothetical protein R3P38DRAFT_2809273 [Favolaschia claudopus]|uniref:Uncharacterized protein n=1 Tax=Favolaschia claudopus TaxID=2862362 RepID=A0AAV9ZDH9_9AGAR
MCRTSMVLCCFKLGPLKGCKDRDFLSGKLDNAAASIFEDIGKCTFCKFLPSLFNFVLSPGNNPRLLDNIFCVHGHGSVKISIFILQWLFRTSIYRPIAGQIIEYIPRRLATYFVSLVSKNSMPPHLRARNKTGKEASTDEAPPPPPPSSRPKRITSQPIGATPAAGPSTTRAGSSRQQVPTPLSYAPAPSVHLDQVVPIQVQK